MPPPRKKLGEILVEMGVLDELQLQAALGHQQQWGKSLGEALLERGFCRSEDVLKALAKQTGHSIIDLDSQPLDSRLVFTMNVKAAEKHRAVPLRLEGKRNEVLVVAVAAPAGLEALDAILAVSGKQRVVPYLADDAAIERAIGKLYYGRQPTAPKAPPPKPLSKVSIQGEAEIELDESSVVPTLLPAAPAPVRPAVPALERAPELKAPSRPVLLYGWKESAAVGLAKMLEQAGVSSRAVDEQEILGCTHEDTVFSSTLSLEALLPPRERLPALVIIAGMPNDEDMSQAKALGANVYLRAPLNAEQLVQAVKKGNAERATRRRS